MQNYVHYLYIEEAIYKEKTLQTVTTAERTKAVGCFLFVIPPFSSCAFAVTFCSVAEFLASAGSNVDPESYSHKDLL